MPQPIAYFFWSKFVFVYLWTPKKHADSGNDANLKIFKKIRNQIWHLCLNDNIDKAFLVPLGRNQFWSQFRTMHSGPGKGKISTNRDQSFTQKINRSITQSNRRGLIKSYSVFASVWLSIIQSMKRKKSKPTSKWANTKFLYASVKRIGSRNSNLKLA